MCIAIFQPVGTTLTDEVLKTCFENNNDGCGFSYINEDDKGVRKIKIKKTMDFSTFLRQYKRAKRVAPSSPFLIHFRIKTHGEVSTFNCHPFKIDDGHVFIHNGIIQSVGTDARKSDTQLFNEKILKNLEGNWMGNGAIQELIEDRIGYSKLAIMNLEGDVQIYNESKGNWKDGIWFSNTSYTPKTTYYNSGTYKTKSTYKKPTTPSYGGQGTATAGNKDKGTLAVSKWTRRNCAKCSSSYIIKNMVFLVDLDDIQPYCLCCGTKLLGKGTYTKSDAVSMENYLDWVNAGMGTFDDARMVLMPPTAEVTWWGNEVDNPYLIEDYYDDLDDTPYGYDARYAG